MLKKANELGYKTYLYFIATESPKINISRVKYRVSRGGHDAPSGSKEFWLAETQNGKIVEIKTESIPAWFNKYVIKKLN